MINGKEKDKLIADLGRLNYQSAMLVKLIHEYQEELTDVNKQINDIYCKISGVKEDGSTVCEKK